MDARLQEMLDHYEITRTLSEYCHGCDRCDHARMASVYLDDSWDDHGDKKLPGKDFVDVIIPEILQTTDSLSHMLGQSIIKIDGDEAGAETYFLAVASRAGEDGVTTCNQLGGRFVDRLRREDGRWRIWKRVVVRDWGISIPVDADWTARVGLTPGARSDADPSFAALRRAHGGCRPS